MEERLDRVQINETPLFYAPNDFGINDPTEVRDFHVNVGTQLQVSFYYQKRHILNSIESCVQYKAH